MDVLVRHAQYRELISRGTENQRLIQTSPHTTDNYWPTTSQSSPPWYLRIHRWIESSKEQHLFETEIFCNIINVFTVTFDQFNASLMNKSINLFFKYYWPKTFEWQCLTVSTKILCSTTVFNINNNHKYSLSSKSVYYYDFWRSCDTEDCSNDAENTALIT